jgi:hypothetical protein
VANSTPQIKLATKQRITSLATKTAIEKYFSLYHGITTDWSVVKKKTTGQPAGPHTLCFEPAQPTKTTAAD